MGIGSVGIGVLRGQYFAEPGALVYVVPSVCVRRGCLQRHR